jgi:hypothetical protein
MRTTHAKVQYHFIFVPTLVFARSLTVGLWASHLKVFQPTSASLAPG